MVTLWRWQRRLRIRSRFFMRNSKKIFVFDSINQLTRFVVKRWRQIARTAIKSRGIFTVALSGGKTPVSLYRRLSQSKEKLPWTKTHLFLVDERLVSLASPRSNYGLIRRYLLKSLPMPQRNIHSLPADNATLKASVRYYEKTIREFFGLSPQQFPRFDLVVLGIGEDGHTASLFPSMPFSNKEKRLVVGVARKDVKNKRVTITLPVINNARNIFFLVVGKSKADVFRRVLEGSCFLPAGAVRPLKGRLLFLVDRTAASKIRG